MAKYILAIFMVAILNACGTGGDRNEKVITVSILPFKYFTESIAGQQFSVNVLVPPGASPATYEPSPSSIMDLGRSDGIILDGYLGYELAWGDKMNQVGKRAAKLVLGEGLRLVSGSAHSHGDAEHDTGVDPHFWMSPEIASEIALKIKDFMVRLDPVNIEQYNLNYLHLVDEIKSVKEFADSLLLPLAGSSFMIFHPALTYLAADYGLEQVPVEVEGKEPTPSGLKDFIDHGREENIRVIFVQREFDKKNAAVIAREIGASLVEIDPLSEDWPASIRFIAISLAKSINDRENFNR